MSDIEGGAGGGGKLEPYLIIPMNGRHVIPSLVCPPFNDLNSSAFIETLLQTTDRTNEGGETYHLSQSDPTETPNGD